MAAGFVQAGPSTAPAQPLSDRAAIQALLARRAAAVMENDKSAFMATVAGASQDFRRRQRRTFEWMRRVPFRSYELQAKWSVWGDLARPGDHARYPVAEGVTIPVTQERYRIRGLDPEPAVEDLFLSYVKEDGRWFIASDSNVEDLGFQTIRHVWDFGPVVVRKQGQFAVLRHPCDGREKCAHLPSGLGPLLENGLRRAREHWSGPWPKRIGVVVPDTARELRLMLQASFDITEFIAFTYSTIDGLRYRAPRVVLNWRTLEGRSPGSLENVFAHELVHVGTRSSAGPFVPIFVDEGYAEHVANAGSSTGLVFFDVQRSLGAIDGSLPDDYEFTTGSGSAIFLNYQTAQSAIGFFVRTWGPRAFERFYKRLGARRSVPGTSDFQVSRAMKRTIGIGLGRFERAWADSLGL